MSATAAWFGRARAATRRFATTSLLFVPTVVMVSVFVLGMFRISGSSIALHDEADPTPTLLEARPGRNDEWAQRTPMVIRQAKLGFPTTTDMGLGVHDAGVLSDLPVKSYSAVLKPHTWLYFALDVERAFAVEWWLVVFGPLLGTYAVLAAITRARLVPALAGLLVAAAPVATWWAIPTMGLSILYGGITAALLIEAGRAAGRRRLLFAALAGWTASWFVSLLYLPWLIPLSILLGLVVLSQFRGAMRGWRQALPLALGFGATFATLMALFYIQHRTAIAAIANTVYPGARVAISGETREALFFGAPFDVFSTAKPFVTVTGNSQTEAASGMMLWLPIALVGGVFGGWRSRAAAPRALAAVLVGALVLAAWSFFPVPQRLGALLGLTNVQASRLVLPLTVAGALAAGLYVHRLRTDGSFRPPGSAVSIASMTFFFITGLAAVQFRINDVAPSEILVIALLIVATVLTAAILRGGVVFGLGGMCVLLLFSAVRVNPLQIGLGPVLHDPLMGQIEDVRIDDPSARWAALGSGSHTRSILMASGASTATGVSWYPDPQAWHMIDPADVYEPIWNRFALVSVDIVPTVTTPQVELLAADAVIVHTPACGGALQSLEVTYVISDDAVSSPCLELLGQPALVGQRWIYRVVDQPPTT